MTAPQPRNKAVARQKMTRAQKAERLLENPLLQEAFDNVEERIDELWKKPDGTPEDREQAYLLHRLWLQLKKEFEVVIRDGKDAARLLTHEEQQRGRRSRRSKPERT